MNPKAVIALVLIALGTGLYIGKTYYARVETKQIETEVERIKNNVVTVTREVVKPDGTKVIDTTITDKSIEKKDTKTTKITVAAPLPDWHISASASTDFKGLEPVYGLQIERRILGPFSLGVRIDTQKTIGLVIGMEF